jgi:hypothetical protein
MKHRALTHVGAIVVGAIIAGVVACADSARSRASYTDLAVDRTYHMVQGRAPVAIERKAVPFRKVATSALPAHMHR